MPQALGAPHLEIRVLLDQRHVSDIEVLDEIHFAGQQRIQPRRGIRDRDEFDLVEVGLVVLVIAGVAGQPGRDAWLEAFKQEGAGAFAGQNIDTAPASAG